MLLNNVRHTKVICVGHIPRKNRLLDYDNGEMWDVKEVGEAKL